jgi:nitroimidazol reductase NimA-like FMN-containing flavoprotein (pyridoxamine 5'-phosphate oxidase superfamily)
VPLNYGFSWDDGKLTLYFHGATEGKKIDIIQKNNNVCFEIDCDGRLIEKETACDYTYDFTSIIGFGEIVFLNSKEEKIDGLNYLMKHQSGRDIKHEFNEQELNNVCVFKMVVEEFTGKQKTTKRN